jgi:uncharacterized protein
MAASTGPFSRPFKVSGPENNCANGALAADMLLTAAGNTVSAIAQALTNAAQLVVGVSLGVRFTRTFVRVAPQAHCLRLF